MKSCVLSNGKVLDIFRGGKIASVCRHLARPPAWSLASISHVRAYAVPLNLQVHNVQIAARHVAPSAISMDESEPYSSNHNDSDIASDADSDAGGDDVADWAPQAGPPPPVATECTPLARGVLNADVREVFHRLLADEVRLPGSCHMPEFHELVLCLSITVPRGYIRAEHFTAVSAKMLVSQPLLIKRFSAELFTVNQPSCQMGPEVLPWA